MTLLIKDNRGIVERIHDASIYINTSQNLLEVSYIDRRTASRRTRNYNLANVIWYERLANGDKGEELSDGEV